MIRRLESVDPAEAAAAAGLAVVIAGLAVLADALVAAAPSSTLGSADRLAYGLWSVRLEHGLVLTIGLAAVWWGLARGARLSGWRDPALRLTTGLAFGVAALAVAVLLAATDVAVRGHVGSGFSEISLNGRQRTFVWLRQAVTAVGLGAAWALLGAQMSRMTRGAAPAAAWAESDEPAPAVDPARLPTPEPIAVETVARVAPPVAPPPAELPQERPERVTPPVAVPGTDTAGGTLSARARHIYRDRLAYSPRGPAARELADRIEGLELAGDTAEAERLLAELESL